MRYSGGMEMLTRCKNILFLCLILIISDSVYSQTKPTYSESESADLSASEDSSKHAIYFGAGGGTDMVYLGTSLSNNNPFYAASITYGFRNSLFVAASATHLATISPFTAFYNGTLNYNHAFNSWFDISVSLAGYKTSESLQDSLFSDFLYADFTAGLDWKLIYTRITLAEVIAQENGFYLRINNSRYFETPTFFSGKSMISFDPDISLLLGNIITTKTSSGTNSYGNNPPFSRYRLRSGGNSESFTEKFGFIDIAFSLPVTFSYGRLSLELEPAYTLPVNTNLLYYESKGFTFYLNLFYKIL